MAAVTLAGPESTAAIPLESTHVVLETKATWGGAWTQRKDLQFMLATVASAGQGETSTCEVRFRYGSKMEPGETDFTDDVEALDLLGHWLRLRLIGDQGNQVVFVGRIEAESRDILGTDAGGASRTGRQVFVAHGGEMLLHQIRVGNSFWLVSGSEQELGWAPSFNARDRHARIVGNRSTAKSGGVFLFSGSDGETWTRQQALDYILVKLADQSGNGGPAWSLAGQVDALSSATDTIAVREGMSLFQLVSALIPNHMGVDWKVVPTDDDAGFEVFVFGLFAEDVSYGEVSLPKNPSTVSVSVGDTARILRAKVIRSASQRYSKVRLRGDRMVVCCSLRGANALPSGDGSLVGKWGSALETAYDAAAAGSAAVNDRYRQGDEFRPVYQQLGAPVSWDHQNGLARPTVESDGTVAPLTAADRQLAVRSTLQALPLREGHDYSGGGDVDNNLSGHEADFMPVAAWVYDEENARYVAAEEVGIGVSASQTDWGVFLSAAPNHRLARNQFGSANDTEFPPEFDYTKAVATIAFESDQRLILEHSLPTADEDGSVLELNVPGAALWYLAPDTAVGTDPTGGGLKTSGTSGRVLRDDSARLAQLMAGLIGRYLAERARADVEMVDLQPWGDLVGSVLSFVDQDGDAQKIGAPVTRVRWVGGGDNRVARTLLSAGFHR